MPPSTTRALLNHAIRLPSQSQHLSRTSLARQLQCHRCISSTSSPASQHPQSPPSAPSPSPNDSRWLSTLKSRLGHCITFGLTPDQTQSAGKILHELARDWRELVAASEGFLTMKGRRGLWRREVVWGDMDSMNRLTTTGHVNNVVYNHYAECARVNFASDLAKADPEHSQQWREIWTPKGEGLILKTIRTDFKFPMTYPDRVTVLVKFRDWPEEGSDKFSLDVVMLSEAHQRVAARCTEDNQMYDYRAGKKTMLRPFMVKKMQETYLLQEEQRKKFSARRKELDQLVERLEKESWDRADAVEDMGSARP